MGQNNVTGVKSPKPGSVKCASQGRIKSIVGQKSNYGSNASKTSGLTVTNER